jgi:hypothetical protein
MRKALEGIATGAVKPIGSDSVRPDRPIMVLTVPNPGSLLPCPRLKGIR